MKKVLLIENLRTERKKWEVIFKKQGCWVTSVSSEMRAVQKDIISQKYDFVILGNLKVNKPGFDKDRIDLAVFLNSCLPSKTRFFFKLGIFFLEFVRFEEGKNLTVQELLK